MKCPLCGGMELQRRPRSAFLRFFGVVGRFACRSCNSRMIYWLGRIWLTGRR